MTEITLQSLLTCPQCGVQTQQQMPTNYCQWYFRCDACRALVKPLPGDCCVFCSYGTVKCPPQQAGKSCC